MTGKAETGTKAVDEALASIRKAAQRQLGVERPPPAHVDPASLVRFSSDLPTELSPVRREELATSAERLQPWLQGPFLLGGDLVVGGVWRNDERWLGLEKHVPADLSGIRVLDVGSNAGYDAFMFKLRGAEHVLACEPSGFHAQALFLESIYQSGVAFEQIGWEDLAETEHGTYDLIHCHGVLYHEPHPMQMLCRLRTMLAKNGTAYIGSMMLAKPELSEYVRFVPGSYYGDETWWWVPGRLATRWMLEAAGFQIEEEFGTSGGPPGEFPVINGYFRATAGSAALAESPERSRVKQRFPAGHYYSPVPDTSVLATEPRRGRIWPPQPPASPGIEWRDEAQVELCTQGFARQERLVFQFEHMGDPRDYFASNDQFPILDAAILEGVLRHFKPRRMVEVGSGYSSLVTARVNRELLDEQIRFTCIEPYPRDFLVEGVPGISELRVEEIQDTPLELFQELGDGDVLFIDTSHTVKTGGDVPWLYNQVIPSLRPGVVVHLHDAFLPGDYPEQWVLDGWGWNELYLIQAFLAFNSAFEVVFGAQWMLQHHLEELRAAFPVLKEERHMVRGGASLWIRRT
jgi:SAM-dependent methyltransferase/predicted O-methyltransferase YrrM